MPLELNTEKNPITNRVGWVDTLKFLGILAIYVGHFRHSAGQLVEFVFIYHVPLFFFIAGFFIKESNKTFLQFLKEKILQLIIPYIFFALLFTLYISIYYQLDLYSILKMLAGFGLGIRNTLAANSLWFFTCLFLITILHFFIQKVFKKKAYQLLLAFTLFILIQVLPANNPIEKPSWIWNVDSALYFYVYYVLGSIVFPWLNKSGNEQSKPFKITSWIGFLVGLLLAIALFTQGKNFLTLILIHQFSILAPFQHEISLGLYFVYALILFFIQIKIAQLLMPIKFLGNLGKQTLIFCGTENIFKIALFHFFYFIHFKLPLTTPLYTAYYY